MIGNRLLASSVAVVSALSAVATASPFSAGVSIGRAQSADDSDNTDPNTTWGLWGRMRVAGLFSTQLELYKYDNVDGAAMGSLHGVAIVDLRRHGHLIPIALAGVGYEWTNGQQSGFDVAAGVGLEYRTDGGFIVGLDARLGTRSVSSPDEPLGCNECLYAAAPTDFRNGEYRAVRLAVGMHF